MPTPNVTASPVLMSVLVVRKLGVRPKPCVSVVPGGEEEPDALDRPLLEDRLVGRLRLGLADAHGLDHVIVGGLRQRAEVVATKVVLALEQPLQRIAHGLVVVDHVDGAALGNEAHAVAAAGAV